MSNTIQKKLSDDDYTEYVSCSGNSHNGSDINWPNKPNTSLDYVSPDPDTDWNDVKSEPSTNRNHESAKDPDAACNINTDYDYEACQPYTNWDDAQNTDYPKLDHTQPEPDTNWNEVPCSSDFNYYYAQERQDNNCNLVPYTEGDYESYEPDNDWEYVPNALDDSWHEPPVPRELIGKRKSSEDYESPETTQRRDSDYEAIEPTPTNEQKKWKTCAQMLRAISPRQNSKFYRYF